MARAIGGSRVGGGATAAVARRDEESGGEGGQQRRRRAEQERPLLRRERRRGALRLGQTADREEQPARCLARLTDQHRQKQARAAQKGRTTRSIAEWRRGAEQPLAACLDELLVLLARQRAQAAQQRQPPSQRAPLRSIGRCATLRGLDKRRAQKCRSPTPCKPASQAAPKSSGTLGGGGCHCPLLPRLPRGCKERGPLARAALAAAE